MKFLPQSIDGVYLIEIEPREDERGFFARTFCAREFRSQGLCSEMVQSNLSFSRQRHTLRGMHYQRGSAAEAKLIRCSRGRILDVIIDLRPESATFCSHQSFELAPSTPMLYVPEGLAHGFLTLDSETEVVYQVSNEYQPKYEAGVRWNDARFAIPWPIETPIISDKDRQYPDFTLLMDKY
ncbi:MAG: dTDP-4-dehydrorhamnose 3,5-epimerase [Candidatus Melainabacteria bacterium HGW-Melainabacteria-1]|nr:MAG: dTDP-4-dehydrorhamnose 3,5-epimerase [Candidatus Melainabacteria bacterium HGW-Melainabacteria-1]